MTRIPLDATGLETLDIMSQAPNYNAWQISAIAPYVGRRVCEIGAGIGNLSTLLLGLAPDLLLLTDTDPFYLDRLRERMGTRGHVHFEPLSLPDSAASLRFRAHHLDTVVAFNVIEHIQDDVGALATMGSMVRSGGRVIVLVPAMQALYGSLDRELSHQRRYSRSSLARALDGAGCSVSTVFYFNMLGAFGWWFNARILGVPRIPARQLRWFDRLVPMLRLEDQFPRPFGLSVIGVGTVR